MARKPAKPEDVVVLGPELPDAQGRFVLRKRGERVEAGAIRPSEEGKPITGELVKLSPREDEGLYDVEVLHDGRPKPVQDARSGPPQVATDGYRAGWNRLFGKRRSGPSSPN
jgi:hypothetical protein